MPQVDLSKEECEYLSLVMNEAVAQAEGELTANPNAPDVLQTMLIRSIFLSIKSKMDLAKV